MKMKTIALALLIAATVPALAFHKDKPEGFQYHPEQPESVVENQMGETGYHGEVGIVEGDIRKPDTMSQSDDPDAARAILKASQDEEKAQAALLQASKDLEGKRGGPSPVMWGVLVLVVVGGGVFALKKYADKVVPEPPKRTKPRW